MYLNKIRSVNIQFISGPTNHLIKKYFTLHAIERTPTFLLKESTKQFPNILAKEYSGPSDT